VSLLLQQCGLTVDGSHFIPRGATNNVVAHESHQPHHSQIYYFGCTLYRIYRISLSFGSMIDD
jgi:hypothetical protein